MYRRHGTWPIVSSRRAAPAQRLVGLVSLLLLLAFPAAAVSRLLLPPARLGFLAAPPLVRAAGWVLLLGGTELTLAAQRQMGASWRVGIDDRPTPLVTHGVFRHVRNPIFLGLLLALAGLVCHLLAWWTVGLWLLVTLLIRAQIAWEERHLLALHGAAHADYTRTTGRLLPSCRGRPPAGPSPAGGSSAG